MVRGLAALFTDLEQLDIGLTRRLALVPLTGERRATNYRQLTDLLLEATRDEAPRPEETVRWLGQQIARAEERSQSEERQLQLSSDREAVQIVTMHKAKGLEYPLVFCPFLADSIKEHKGVAQISAPAGNAGETASDLLIQLDLLDDTNKEARVRELMAAQLEERLRLAYVALTRAQKYLFVTWAPVPWIGFYAPMLTSQPIPPTRRTGWNQRKRAEASITETCCSPLALHATTKRPTTLSSRSVIHRSRLRIVSNRGLQRKHPNPGCRH